MYYREKITKLDKSVTKTSVQSYSKTSKVIDSTHIDISNPLSILDVISFLKLCIGKAGDTRRDLKKIESSG